MLASDVMARSAVLLNDAAQATWTNTVLLPCLAHANEELEQELLLYEIPLLRQVQSPVTSVEIADAELDEYPVDFIVPIELWERALNSTNPDDWKQVDEVEDIDKSKDTSSEITEWNFRNNKIYFNPPTSARETYLVYERMITAVSIAGSTIELPQSRLFLATRTAQIAALNLGNSPTKADSLQKDVDINLDRVIRRLGKNKQGTGGARRLPYRGRSYR